MAQSTPSQQLLEKIVSLAKRRGFIFQSSEIYGGLNGCWDYGPLGVEMLRNLKDAWWRAMTQRGDIEGLDASILMHPKVWEASGHVQNFSDPMVDCRECKSRYRVDHLLEGFSDKQKHALNQALEEVRSKLSVETIKEIIEENENRTGSSEASKELFGFLTANKYYHYSSTEYAERLSVIFQNYPEIFESVKEIIVCPNCGRRGTLTPPRNFNLMFETYVGPVKDDSNVVSIFAPKPRREFSSISST